MNELSTRLLTRVGLHREAVHRKIEIEFEIRAQARDFGSLRSIDLDTMRINAEEAAELDLRFKLACIEVADTHLDMLVAMHNDRQTLDAE